MSNSGEIVLSTDINIITAEINSYKQVAGQAIFEIGRRIQKVHDEKLAESRGGWTGWLREIDMSTSQADRFMKVVKEIDQNKLPHVGNISFRVLYEISTLPEEERGKSHTIPSTGQSKKVDEMIVRELREVKDALAKEKEANKALLDTVQALKDQEPKIIETIKEVIPETHKQEVETLKTKLKQEEAEKLSTKERLQKLAVDKADIEKRLKEIEDYQKGEQFEIDKMRREKEKLELQAHISISSLQIGIHRFVEEYAPSVFLQGAVASSTFMMRDDLLDSIISLEEFTKKLREMLYAKIEVNKNNIIELN